MFKVRVLFVASEVAPFSKTGGLADVAGALPKALIARGVEVLTVSPLWPSVPRKGLYGEQDDARRFAVLSTASLAAAQLVGFAPDVVHLNDWQTGLAALALS